MVQARISEMFAPESNAGIRIFSGGKDLIDIADMAAEERDAILYCFDQNVKKIENVSPKLAAGLRPQREAMVKFAQIAKGTFPETKTYSYPGQSGGLAVDFLNPYLYKYVRAGSTVLGHRAYTSYADSGVVGYSTWDINLATVGTKYYIAGNGTTGYYRGSDGGDGTTGAAGHSYVVIFQDGIIELGTTPKIEQIHFKSELLDKYTPISMPVLLNQSIEEGKNIYQYTTPGMIPISHQTGVQIAVLPNAAGVSTLPLLGMVFYETEFNDSAMAARIA
jgi:hypothetical protein